MGRLSSNKMLPWLGGLILLAASVVAANALFVDGTAKPEPRTNLPTPDDLPDGDTPADTIRTLTAKLDEVNKTLHDVVEKNSDLTAQNQTLQNNETKLRAEISAELEQKLAAAQENQSSQIESSVSLLGNQLEALKSSLDQSKKEQTSDPQTATDYPVANGPTPSPLGNQSYVWIEPLDAGQTGTGLIAVDQQDGGSLLATGFEPEGEASALVTDQSTGSTTPEPASSPEPFFTINNLATLAESTTFTALVGRVPIGNQVSDPLPFRVLVGRENLAASGLRVPDEIASMVFEGVGIGDWTLGCVEGKLRTATFIFEDGTIRTVEGELGIIADQFGVQCVAGKRVSNAAPYLTAAVGLAAGAGAAEAFAAAETAQVVDDGAVVSAVVGNAAKFALGNAATEGIGEIQTYLADRLNSTFDAVFVPAGAEVSLLIQQEISIDYNPKGRKLDYATSTDRQPRRLD